MTLLRLKYLKVYCDRHGTVRRYFHRRGQKDLPLKGEPGTTEFMLAYQAAFGATAPVVDQTKAGTFARLIADYCRSSAFANLKPSSQKLYKLVLDRITERHGHRLVRDARRSDARKMVEEIGAAKPAMANITRAVLRLLMQYAVETELRLDNPVTGLKAYRTGTRHTWTDDELAQFERRWPLGTRERLAFALLLYTGQRAGDIVKMRRSDMYDGLIRVIQQRRAVHSHTSRAPGCDQGRARQRRHPDRRRQRPSHPTRNPHPLHAKSGGASWPAEPLRATRPAQGDHAPSGRKRIIG